MAGASEAAQAVSQEAQDCILKTCRLPRMLPVRQHFPDRSLPDVRGEVLRQLSERAIRLPRARQAPASRIGVGSRGIANIAAITRAAVDYWKSQGCRPFIFPAMGSHGGATAEGQADVLAHYRHS